MSIFVLITRKAISLNHSATLSRSQKYTKTVKKGSRKERRQEKINYVETDDTQFTLNLNFKLKHLEPLTPAQKTVFQEYNKGKNLLLTGSAGTGKTYISIYLAMKELIESGTKRKLHIIRSAQSSKDLGFLPGNIKEKTKIYEAPYIGIFADLFNRGDAYEYLKQKGIVEFHSTSFLRGLTLDDCIIIVDETQNATFQEADTIISRLGNNTKIIFAGDYKQSDLRNNYAGATTKEEILTFFNILKEMKYFSSIRFTVDDIVRGALVKEYLTVKEQMGH